MEKSRLISVAAKGQMTLLGIIICLLIIAGGFTFFSYEKRSVRDEKHREIRAIAALKISQITRWHKERKSEIKAVTNAPYFVRGIKAWTLDPGNSKLKKAILAHLQNIATSFSYQEILLTSPEGKIYLSSLGNDSPTDPVASDFIAKAASQKKISFTDFYYSPVEKKTHYDVVAPMMDEKGLTVAMLVFRIDPNQFLFPYIHSWPTPSKTSETNLLRKDGDSVLFLSDVRHLKNTALNLRISLTNKEVPAVYAITGHTGVFEGKDYRGVEVLSWVGPVPGTPWFLVAKVDKKEVYSELLTRAVFITVMVLILIILTIAAISWIYYLRQRDIYRELFFNENKLRESQEEFKTILYSIGDGVITTDKNGLIRQMNPVAEKLTGWNENEATGLPLDKVFRIIHEISRKVVENPVELVLKKGMIVSPVNHTLLISKSGNEIPIADSGAPILKEGKEVSGVVLIFRDQTKERMAHEALTERDRRYESFINSSRDMIFIKDDRFRYIVVNDQIARFLNRSKEDMLLKTDFELMDEKEAAECKLTDEKTIHSLSPVITEEIFGDKIYETNKFRLILSGNRIGIGGIMRDITASKNMMSELIEAKNKAEENNRLKTAFLNNLSHEIRTPLNGIVGFTELINDPSTNILDRVRFGKIVKKNSDWLLAIITDIISIATIETGQEKLNESPTDINKLFYDLYHRFILVLNDKPIELSFRNGLSQEESEVIADEGKLKQVIANLLSNAIKFTEKGAIKVQCNLDDRQLKFSVEDTGIGIPENLQQVIFEKFRKGETDNDKIYQGNGLGLAISKAYVELMGGTIIVKSRPGEGSCFTFTILHRTVELEQSNRIKHKMINENAPSATTKTILVVEDEESNYLLIEKMLFPSAFRTIHVTNGQDAVMECMGHPEIELILMDLKLPGMSGYEATRRIKEKFPHLPIVAVTAYALAGDREKALNAGCDDYLPKPFDRRDLMEMINKHWRVES